MYPKPHRPMFASRFAYVGVSAVEPVKRGVCEVGAGGGGGSARWTHDNRNRESGGGTHPTPPPHV